MLRAGLDVTFRKNKDGNLGSFLLARETGFMSAIGLNKNKLPVLTLQGSKPMYPACPDSLDDLIECYKAAADARAKRMGGRSYHAVHESEESSDDDDAEACSHSKPAVLDLNLLVATIHFWASAGEAQRIKES